MTGPFSPLGGPVFADEAPPNRLQQRQGQARGVNGK